MYLLWRYSMKKTLGENWLYTFNLYLNLKVYYLKIDFFVYINVFILKRKKFKILNRWRLSRHNSIIAFCINCIQICYRFIILIGILYFCFSVRSVMHKHLEKMGEVNFEKIFNQKLGKFSFFLLNLKVKHLYISHSPDSNFPCFFCILFRNFWLFHVVY